MSKMMSSVALALLVTSAFAGTPSLGEELRGSDTKLDLSKVKLGLVFQGGLKEQCNGSAENFDCVSISYDYKVVESLYIGPFFSKTANDEDLVCSFKFSSNGFKTAVTEMGELPTGFQFSYSLPFDRTDPHGTAHAPNDVRFSLKSGYATPAVVGNISEKSGVRTKYLSDADNRDQPLLSLGQYGFNEVTFSAAMTATSNVKVSCVIDRAVSRGPVSTLSRELINKAFKGKFQLVE